MEIKLFLSATKEDLDADSQAQQLFLQRVREKAYQPFDGPNNLSLRIARRIWSWSQQGFRGLARAQSLRPSRQPTEDDIQRLIQKELLVQFKDDYGIITRPGNPRAACFVIHGPPAGGHKYIAARLRKELETQSQWRQYSVSLGPLWRQKTTDKLIDIIGLTIEQGWVPGSMDALFDRFKTILAETDVLLEVNGVHRLKDKLPGFVEEFWRPLAMASANSVSHRLIAMVTVEETLRPEWEEFVQPALKEEALTFDTARPIRLPETHNFTATDVMIWLLNGGWVNSQDAQDLAQTLIDETKGVPQLLYAKLAEDATWIFPEEI
jgi:inactive STAND